GAGGHSCSGRGGGDGSRGGDGLSEDGGGRRGEKGRRGGRRGRRRHGQGASEVGGGIGGGTQATGCDDVVADAAGRRGCGAEDQAAGQRAGAVAVDEAAVRDREGRVGRSVDAGGIADLDREWGRRHIEGDARRGRVGVIGAGR